MKWILPLLFTACLFRPFACAAADFGSIQFSADGKYFAASFKETLNVGTVKDRKIIRSIGKDEDARKGNWNFLGFTPDSRRLAVYYHWTRELKFLSLDGAILSQFAMPSPDLISRSFRWAVTGSGEGSRRVYSLASLSGEAATPKFLLQGEPQQPQISPGDKLLAYIKEGRYLEVMDVKTGKYLKRFTAPGEKILGSPQFSPDGKLLAFADSDNSVRVVSLGDWKTVGTVSRSGTPVNAIAFSPDMAYLAVDYGGWALRVYSLPDYRPLLKTEFEGENEWSITGMAFSRDSSFLGLSGVKYAKSAGEGRHSVKFINLKK
jgi:WD40 repeat protein